MLMQTQCNDPLNTPLTKPEKNMNDAIGLYLNDIGKVALLTAEDERTLSKAIEKGREAAALYEAGEKTAAVRKDMKAAAVAKDHFIRSNLRLVVSIARRYPLP